MSDLFDAFDDALAPRSVTDAARAQQVVDVIEHRVRVRRRTRAVSTAAAGFAAAGALATGAMFLSPLGDGGAQDPAAAPTPSWDDIEATFPPTDADDVPVVERMWTQTEPGSFLLAEPIAFAQEGDADGSEAVFATSLTMLPPDGVAMPAGQIIGDAFAIEGWGASGVLVTDLGAQRQQRWWDGTTGAFASDAAQVSSGNVVALLGDRWVAATPVSSEAGSEAGGDDLPELAFQLSLVSSEGGTELCRTVDASEPFAMVAPNGGTVVCFDPVGPETTDVVVVDIAGEPDATVVTTFTHAADQYRLLGWLSDDELLFARPAGAGYRYFILDVRAGSWADAFLPGELDGTLPLIDPSTGSYVVASWGKASVYDADGSFLGEADCAASVPQVFMASQRALIACADGDELSLQLLDLSSGTLIDTGRGARLGPYALDAEGSFALEIFAYDPR